MTCALVAIDPALRRTGAAVYSFDTDPSTGRAMPGTALLLLATSDTRRAVDQFEALSHEIEQTIGVGVQWCAVIEKPTPRGGGTPPTAAYRFWCEEAERWARARAEAAGVRYRRPRILTPMASQWRGPLGIATRAPVRGGKLEDRRLVLKQQAVAYAQKHLKAGVLDADAAEAVCLGAWALRCLALGVAPSGRGRFKEIHYVA